MILEKHSEAVTSWINATNGFNVLQIRRKVPKKYVLFFWTRERNIMKGSRRISENSISLKPWGFHASNWKLDFLANYFVCCFFSREHPLPEKYIFYFCVNKKRKSLNILRKEISPLVLVYIDRSFFCSNSLKTFLLNKTQLHPLPLHY